jgi:hypothetical protein
MQSNWFEPGSISFEWAKNAPTILFTFMLGYLAYRIARNQWYVAKAKLNLDLFEKRYAVFQATHRVLLRHTAVPNSKKPDGLLEAQLPAAEFLFGPEVRDYVIEVIAKEHLIWFHYEKNDITSTITEEQATESELTDLTDWFSIGAYRDCSKVFGPYLDFKNWRGTDAHDTVIDNAKLFIKRSYKRLRHGNGK